MDVISEHDIELIRRVISCDYSAFKSIVEKYESKIAAVIYGIIGPCTEVEDIGQETFIRLYKGLKNFKGESNLETYITRIAINLSLNELKKRKKAKWMFLTMDEIKHPVNDIRDYSRIEQDETNKIILQMIDRLSPKLRSVIALRFISGYSIKETAKILQIAEGTVMSRLARAQNKLKSLLKPFWGDIDEKDN